MKKAFIPPLAEVGVFCLVLDKNIRLVLAYQCKHNEQTFTAASVAAKAGISEEEAKNALEKLCVYSNLPNRISMKFRLP